VTGRHVSTATPPIRMAAGERCPHVQSELCPVGCDRGGTGRHLAIPRHPVRWPAPDELAAMMTRPRQSTWLGVGIAELAARSSSQAGLATFRGAR